ncbi:MAG: glycoside hydrolase family 76 protein [Bryobacteraceae bacterium]
MNSTTGTLPVICGEAVARAGQWFLRSGIQAPHGGVARYHFITERRNAQVSTEITGYSVSTLLELHERTGGQDFLEAARRAGDFLCRAWDEEAGAMPFEWSPTGGGAQLSYFFDNGIIVRGLLRLWRTTGEDRYRQVAERCGESMQRDFVSARDIHPILALPSKLPLPRDGRWSASSGCYQLKSALAWLELAEATGEKSLAEAFEKALKAALSTHESFLDAAPDDTARMDRLHAYSYFLEALLARAANAAVRQALREGIGRVAAELRRIRSEFERSDVNAQLLRVRLWADALGLVPLDERAACEEAQRIAGYQMPSPDPALDGTFNFGSRRGALSNFANPVSTAFCLQALALWEEHNNGGLKTPLHRLI